MTPPGVEAEIFKDEIAVADQLSMSTPDVADGGRVDCGVGPCWSGGGTEE